ncbi:MAG: DNA-binding protein, partial [Mesorhizobium sp.]
MKPMTTLAVKPLPENIVVAAKLRDFADLLDSQGADGFRARAYRSAADVVARLQQPLGEILAKDGRDGLVALPAIGTGIAGAIAEMIATGRWSQLERLRGEMEPEALFRSIPGIGP